MKPLGPLVLAAILAAVVGAPVLGSAASEDGALAADADANVPSLSVSASAPMYPAFGPPAHAVLET